MFKQFSIGLCATALLLWAVGCSDNPTVPEPVDSPDFTEEFGGYTASPEAPGFGDSELIASENDEEEIDAGRVA